MNLISAETAKRNIMITAWIQMHKDKACTFRDHLELKKKSIKAIVKSSKNVKLNLLFLTIILEKMVEQKESNGCGLFKSLLLFSTFYTSS